jgi:nitrate reductase NapAB chaperone NapD
MQISGLLVTLKPDVAAAEHARAALDAMPFVEAGSGVERWLPVVVEAETDEESRRMHDSITALPGVEFVDVVYVHFVDPDSAEMRADTAQPSPSAHFSQIES